MMLDDRTRSNLIEATRETIQMVSWSTLFAVSGGLLIGVLLVMTRRGGVAAFPPVYWALDLIVNIGRSIPFIILLVFIIPFTRQIVGTSIGTKAAIVPLTVSAIPFFARIVETSLLEVDRGLVEMMQAQGATNWQVIAKLLLPESLPSLIRGVTITIISLVGYSAMAGAVGGGGLGDLAIRYGYQRFQTDVMVATIIVLIMLVQGVQIVGNSLARWQEHR